MMLVPMVLQAIDGHAELNVDDSSGFEQSPGQPDRDSVVIAPHHDSDVEETRLHVSPPHKTLQVGTVLVEKLRCCGCKRLELPLLRPPDFDLEPRVPMRPLRNRN